MRRGILGIVVALAACSSNVPPPTCIEAVGHYHATGCLGSPPMGPPAEELCAEMEETWNAYCASELEDYLRCINELPPVTLETYEVCACNPARAALLSCDTGSRKCREAPRSCRA